jgi:hypothetical protein
VGRPISIAGGRSGPQLEACFSTFLPRLDFGAAKTATLWLAPALVLLWLLLLALRAEIWQLERRAVRLPLVGSLLKPGSIPP